MIAYEYFLQYNGGPRCSEPYIQKYYPEIYLEILRSFPSLTSFRHKCICLRLGLKNIPRCKICDKELTPQQHWADFSDGRNIPDYCSEVCRNKDPNYLAKIGKSMPGEVNPFFGKKHSKETKEKMSQLATGRDRSAQRGVPIPLATRVKISQTLLSRIAQNPQKWKEFCSRGYLTWMQRASRGEISSSRYKTYNFQSIPHLSQIESWLGLKNSCYGDDEKIIEVYDPIACRPRFFRPDFFNAERKLIIEWNEPRHYLIEVRKKDLFRKNLLINTLGPDWIFIEIDERIWRRQSNEERKEFIFKHL